MEKEYLLNYNKSFEVSPKLRSLIAKCDPDQIESFLSKVNLKRESGNLCSAAIILKKPETLKLLLQIIEMNKDLIEKPSLDDDDDDQKSTLYR